MFWKLTFHYSEQGKISHFADFEQVIMSHFADFEQVIFSHFADFEQVIIKISYLATLNKSLFILQN